MEVVNLSCCHMPSREYCYSPFQRFTHQRAPGLTLQTPADSPKIAMAFPHLLTLSPLFQGSSYFITYVSIVDSYS